MPPQYQAIREPPEGLTGSVERVTFHSDESGFCVLRVKVRGHRELVTITGALPEIRPGEWLEAHGRWVVDEEDVSGMPGKASLHAVALYEVEGGLIRRVWFLPSP